MPTFARRVQDRRDRRYGARRLPATAVPDAPTIGTATAGAASASVAWTAPTNNGGSAITGYTVTSSPGGFTAAGAAGDTSATVTGLTNGTAYTFTVVATNAVGNSVASAASNSATPLDVPGAPTIGTAVAGAASASVAWTAPASTGGSAITGYTATSSPGGFTATSASSPVTVTGLADGTTYTFTVTAQNAQGSSAASAASNSVTPPLPTNLLTKSNLLSNAAWGKSGSPNPAPVCTTPSADVTDPFSGSAANKIAFNASGGANQNNALYHAVATGAGAHTLSIWLRTLSGTATTYIFLQDGTNLKAATTCAVTSTWQRFTVTATLAAQTNYPQVGVDQTTAGGFGAAMSAQPAQTIYAYGAQLETGSSANTYVNNP